jgi:hypothetical protein
MSNRLKAKYLLWVTSKQGTAPYFQRVYPKHVAAMMKDTGRDIKVTKRLPVHMDASDLEIMQALDKCNRDFENSIRAYQDPNNRKALHEHEILKAALGLLEMHGLKPGDASYDNAAALADLEEKLRESMNGGHMIDGDVGLKVEELLVEGTEEDLIVDVTVSEAFAMYIQAKPNPKYERVLDRFLADVGNRIVNQSMNRHLHDWVHKQLETRGVKTVEKDASIIRAAMNYAIKANGLNVVIHKPTMPKADSKSRPVLSRDELKELFALDMEQWERQCLVASLCLGAINSELMKMRTDDLNGTLLLRCGEKTEQRYRHVPVPFLDRWKEIRVGETRVRDRLTALIKKVNPDASPYSLRHSAEHYMTIAKVSETDRAAICGWANKGRFHQYGEAAKHNDERLLPLIDVMRETWDWLFTTS